MEDLPAEVKHPSHQTYLKVWVFVTICGWLLAAAAPSPATAHSAPKACKQAVGGSGLSSAFITEREGIRILRRLGYFRDKERGRAFFYYGRRGKNNRFWSPWQPPRNPEIPVKAFISHIANKTGLSESKIVSAIERFERSQRQQILSSLPCYVSRDALVNAFDLMRRFELIPEKLGVAEDDFYIVVSGHSQSYAELVEIRSKIPRTRFIRLSNSLGADDLKRLCRTADGGSRQNDCLKDLLAMLYRLRKSNSAYEDAIVWE